MEKKYVILCTAAFAAGIGLGEADLLEAQAKSVTVSKHVCVDVSGAAAGQMDTFLANQLCGEVESEFALDEGDCNSSRLKAHANGFSIRQASEGTDYELCGHSISVPGNYIGEIE